MADTRQLTEDLRAPPPLPVVSVPFLPARRYNKAFCDRRVAWLSLPARLPIAHIHRGSNTAVNGTTGGHAIPSVMRACVWRGGAEVSVETVPVPSLDPGELLVRVEACGLCPTDIKKIDRALATPPVILGHETVGTVVACAAGMERSLGRRVALYHHVPCRQCRLCELGLYSQCAGYKKTGTTAGFTPAGGGWAEYVRVMPWIAAEGGVVELPPSTSVRVALLMEPLNTCLKCLNAWPEPPGTAVILGLGPVGLMLTALAHRKGWAVYGVEPLPDRRQKALRFGARAVFAPDAHLPARLKEIAPPYGPDAACTATDAEPAVEAALGAVRFGGTVILFGHTRLGHGLTIDAGQIGVAEKRVVGSYSSSIELNGEVLAALLEERIPWKELVTHVFPLEEINAALSLARRPEPGSLKIAVAPGATSMSIHGDEERGS